MINLYFPSADRRHFLKDRIVISSETVDAILDDEERIKKEVRRAINKRHFHRGDDDLDMAVEGASAMVARHIVKQVRDILAYDRTLTPFELAGGEMEGLVRWEFDSGREVNMKYAIDRLDVLDPSGVEQWRIVDYKTGDSYVTAGEFEDIFNGSLAAKNIFQLLLYANLMNVDLGMDRDVKVSIYPVNKLRSDGEATPVVSKTPVEGHKSINKEFVERLNGMLKEIFDPVKPFMPAEDDSHCRYCHLQALCGR